MEKKNLNIIAPVFNEEGNLQNFFSKLKITIDKINQKYNVKIIFANDGSIDNSFEILQSIKQKVDYVEIINFTKNFGHQNALLAGLKEYEADLYLVMDTDLQHNPSLIEIILQNFEKSQAEIVQMSKNYTDYEPIFKRTFSKYFYLLFSKFTKINIDPGSSDFFLITHKVREELINANISHNFIRGFIHWTGFKKITINYSPEKREKGVSNYSYLKLLEFALTGFYFYTTRLFIFIFIFAALIMLFCFIYSIYIIYSYLTGGLSEYAGWSTITILILFFGSISLLLNSVLLFFLTKIFDYSSNKPNYIKKSNNQKL